MRPVPIKRLSVNFQIHLDSGRDQPKRLSGNFQIHLDSDRDQPSKCTFNFFMVVIAF